MSTVISITSHYNSETSSISRQNCDKVLSDAKEKQITFTRFFTFHLMITVNKSLNMCYFCYIKPANKLTIKYYAHVMPLNIVKGKIGVFFYHFPLHSSYLTELMQTCKHCITNVSLLVIF